MLVEPGRTGADLHFRLFGTPVRVHPLFWLVSAILGWSFIDIGFIYLALWIACTFVSILLHEFGHIWAGRVFGAHGQIVLYGMGGLAIGASDLYARWKRVIVFLAGPLIQLVVIYLPLRMWLEYGTLEQIRALPKATKLVLVILLDINLYWPLLNLLPIWPLDGGKICREFCTWVAPAKGLRASLVISMIVAGLFGINALVAANSRSGEGFLPYVPTGGTYMGLFFILFAIENWLLLQAIQRPPPSAADEFLPWERDPDSWKREPWRD